MQVQFKQLGQDVFVAHGGIPAVGGEDGGVEFFVSQVEPGRTLVVEVRQRAFLEVGRRFLILGDQTRIADGADAVQVGVRDVACPRAGGRAGEFEDFLFRPFRRVQPVGAQRIEFLRRLRDGVALGIGRRRESTLK